MLKGPFCERGAFGLRRLMLRLQMPRLLTADRKRRASWIDGCSIGGKTSGIVHCAETCSL